MSKFLRVPSRFSGLIISRRGSSGVSRYQGGTTFEEKDKTGHGTYGSLLFDDRWKKRRIEILNRDNNSCRICGNQSKLQVHHRQYHFIRSIKQFKPPWDYTSDLLITLCESCHSRGHSKFKVPNIYL